MIATADALALPASPELADTDTATAELAAFERLVAM